MKSSRRKLDSILLALGKSPSARRSALLSRAPACESLEGRQLMAGNVGLAAGLHGMSMGTSTGMNMGSGQADVSTGWQQPQQQQSPTGFDGQDPGRMMMAPSAAETQLWTDQQTLESDQQAIHDKSQVTPAMQATVTADIKAIKGAETTTPSASTLATLKADTKLAKANPGGPTDAQTAMIQADQDAVYQSQGVNSALTGKLDTDLAAIKTASNVTTGDEATLAADLLAVQTDQKSVDAAQPATPAPTSTTATPPVDPTSTMTTTATASATPVAPATATSAPTTPPTMPTGFANNVSSTQTGRSSQPGSGGTGRIGHFGRGLMGGFGGRRF